MGILEDISSAVQRREEKEVKPLVEQALPRAWSRSRS